MAMIRRSSLTVVALAGAVGAGCGDAHKVSLRYHPPQGAKYPYTIEQQNGVKFETGPMRNQPEQKIVMHIFFTQTINGPTDGGVGATVRFDSASVDASMAPPGAFGPALDRIRGLTNDVVYDERRNVVRSTTAGTTEPNPVNEQLVKGMKGLSFPFPEKPVGVGDTWTAEVDLPLGQVANAGAPLKARTTVTVKEVSTTGPDTTVLLGLETTLPDAPIVMTQQGQTITMKLSGSLAGDQVYSITRAAAVHSQLGGTIHINVVGPGLGAEGMNMAMTQATSLTLGGVP